MIKVYGKKGCKFCTKTKSLMKKHNIEYQYVDIGKDISLEDFKEQFPEQKTVPLIIVEETGHKFNYEEFARTFDHTL